MLLNTLFSAVDRLLAGLAVRLAGGAQNTPIGPPLQVSSFTRLSVSKDSPKFNFKTMVWYINDFILMSQISQKLELNWVSKRALILPFTGFGPGRTQLRFLGLFTRQMNSNWGI